MAKRTQKKKSARKKKAAVPHSLVLSVLGYREDGEWVALALEMDLRGYGATFEDALAELDDLVIMQTKFARFKEQPEMLSKPAEGSYWRLFETARLDYMRDLALSSIPANPDYEAGSLPLPPPHVIAELSGFREANA